VLTPLRSLNRLLDFCYPGRCATCGSTYDTSAVFCGACESAMKGLFDAPACDRCAMPLSRHSGPCPYCRGKGPPLLDRVVGLGLFKEPLKAAIHRAKYARRWGLAELLTDRLLHQRGAAELVLESDVIVPVPLHPSRQRERGYNQADVVARHIASRLKRRVRQPVVRVIHTETQTHLHSRAKREENLRDAFVLVSPKAVRRRRVLLVDDVMTSGATLRSLARTLRPAEPASVSALVLAVADPRGREFEVI
jgi:ComF family protein